MKDKAIKMKMTMTHVVEAVVLDDKNIMLVVDMSTSCPEAEPAVEALKRARESGARLSEEAGAKARAAAALAGFADAFERFGRSSFPKHFSVEAADKASRMLRDVGPESVAGSAPEVPQPDPQPQPEPEPGPETVAGSAPEVPQPEPEPQH